jgi:hypothetical protein
VTEGLLLDGDAVPITCPAIANAEAVTLMPIKAARAKFNAVMSILQKSMLDNTTFFNFEWARL